MPRVGIIALLQESNTFLDTRTTLDEFRSRMLVSGEDVRSVLAGTHHEVGGFFEGLAAAGIDAVPIFATRATPHGTMTAEAFSALMTLLEEALASAGPVDGMLVAPHGATVSEEVADVDGHWMSLVRRRMGGIPIIGTMDPHANLSPAMVEATDALTAYRTNPHVDQLGRGLEAAALMARTLAGDVTPVQAAAFPPLTINIECQDPAAFPCRPHYDAAARLRAGFESRPASDRGTVPQGTVLSSSIVLGFPYADVPEMGSAAVVVTHGDRAAARRHAADLAAGMWAARETFRPILLGVDEAIERAVAAPGPVCLLDMGDNVGGGSPGDGTRLAREFRRRRLPGSFVCLADGEAAVRAAAAGVGGVVSMAVGGRSSTWQGVPDCEPLEDRWRVVSVTDGRFSEPRPRHGGAASFDQGLTAVLEGPSGLVVMVTSTRTPPFSLEQIRHARLDPAAFRLLAATGVHAPVAAYAEVCPTFVRVDTPGVTAADLAGFSYRQRRRPMFPFEPDTTWQPGEATPRPAT